MCISSAHYYTCEISNTGASLLDAAVQLFKVDRVI